MNINIPKISSLFVKYPYQQISKSNVVNFKSKDSKSDSFEMSIGYVNDIHGQTNNMMRILSGIKGDLKVSAGDNDIGDEKNSSVHKATALFLNQAGIVATAMGNHEIDTTQGDFLDTMDKMDAKVLSVNIHKKKDWKLQDDNLPHYDRRDDFVDNLHNSTIVDVKGEKIGLIGTSPLDLSDRLTHPYYYNDCFVSDLDGTIKEVQAEVDKLKSQGVNKIILLSHIGLNLDKELAQKVDGIDVIISGHTHELIEGVTEGKNLLQSKSGEPVVLTEAGKNGNYFGLLNLAFDKNGVITKVQNNIAETRLFSKNLINQYMFDKVLGKPDEVGFIEKAPLPPKNTMDENPHANFVCDAMKEMSGADIALWHHAGVRGYFRKGPVDSSEIKDMAPFLDRVVTARVSEKKLVDAFKQLINTTCTSKEHKPGLMAVSGLDYTINKGQGKLISMNFIDKDGNKTTVDIEHPREDKFYVVAMDEFLMEAGGDHPKFGELDECLKIYPYDKDVMTCQYIKKLNQPIIINQTGRINFVD